ncbi:MAG: hypothetical protein FWC93_07340 [Defluviitaleaceae bacterium]|nr:hypothetical protein [Defluviitaleaceae bacterium]
MKCYCKQDANGFYYVVEDVPEDKHELILTAFYKKHGDMFLKWYPADMPEKELVVRNYERLAPHIFSRTTVNWENALDTFCTIAKRNAINFIVDGSVSACLHGTAIMPTDIDIVVDMTDFEKTKTVFREYTIEPLMRYDNLLLSNYFGRLCIDNVWIDIDAHPKKGHEIKNIDVKCWNGHIIYVRSLRECLETYKVMGKNKYIAEIEECLRKT